MVRFPKIRFAPSYFLTLAICILVLPLKWMVSILIASFIHEIGHVIALRMLDVMIIEIRIDPLGAKLLTGHITNTQEMISALAGPLFGIGLLIFSGFFPRIAFCGCVQGLVNLIPIYPSDGGRVLNGLLNYLFEAKVAAKIMIVIRCIIFIALGVLSVWFCYVLKLGIMSFIPGGIMMIKCFMAKSEPIKYCLQTK